MVLLMGDQLNGGIGVCNMTHEKQGTTNNKDTARTPRGFHMGWWDVGMVG